MVAEIRTEIICTFHKPNFTKKYNNTDPYFRRRPKVNKLTKIDVDFYFKGLFLDRLDLQIKELDFRFRFMQDK